MWEELGENNNCPSLEAAGDMGPLLMKSMSFFPEASFIIPLLSLTHSDIPFAPVSGHGT